ncbi:MAG: FG-GAP-like repeat-containing protein [Tannerella sp.]|jgi:uncharacterized repeat protein (TIGR02543 family)|nr:FG-GAP-like repeat-containing protein [Tannerella sp.]
MRTFKALMLFILALLPVFIGAQNNLMPDTADCAGKFPTFDFSIRKAWNTSTNKQVNTCHTPLAGDIDGDGIAEIFAMGLNEETLYIFDGMTGDSISVLPISGTIAGTVSSGIVLCNIGGKRGVFNAGENGFNTFWSVTSAPGERPMTFYQEWSNNSTAYVNNVGLMPIVTDFDGDGIPEFVARGSIIDSQDGSLLASLPYISSNSLHGFETSYHIACDLDNDGLPEVVAGSEIYKFSRYTTPTLQLWRSLAGHSEYFAPNRTFEGQSMHADINQDGNVDIVFIDDQPWLLWIWTPVLDTLFSTTIVAYDYIDIDFDDSHSYPFIGDIDGEIINGKKYPEICINTLDTLTAFAFDGTDLYVKWTLPHNDTSGETALTLYDLNNDGVMELIYRDEKHIRILDGRATGSEPIELYKQICGSATCDETPIIADVNGDGSADIVVTGNPDFSGYILKGEVMCFEGGASRWTSCPNVWNQQMYSPLHINLDLTVPDTIKSVNLTYTKPDGTEVQYYNGGPMQAPFISETTFEPLDLTPDVYVVGGEIKIIDATTVELTVTFANQGIRVVRANTPITYYKDAMIPENILDTDVLGVNIRPHSTVTKTIVKTITGLTNPLPTRYYVRILDDGNNFPALGPFGDCNLTNNHKSFGTLELLKTVNSQSACIDGTSIFTVQLINNTDQTMSPRTIRGISLCDSIGPGWQLLSDTVSYGTLTPFDPVTRKLYWDVDTIAAGDTVWMIMTAKALNAGAIRNSAWIETVDGTTLDKEVIEAYVIVNTNTAPPPATITQDPMLDCGSIVLHSSVTGKPSYQWFRNGIEIPGATSQTYTATQPGNYMVSYFEPPCASEISAAFYCDPTCYMLVDDYSNVAKNESETIDILANDILPPGFFGGSFSLCDSIIQQPVQGSLTCTGSGANSKVIYTNSGVDNLTHSIDSFIYRFSYFNPVLLTETQQTATVYIRVIEYPDNVNDTVDCIGTPQSAEWGIQLYKQYGMIHTHQPPLVGDMDNDGFTDIVLMNHPPLVPGDIPDSVIILKGPDFNTSLKFKTNNTYYCEQGIARVKYSDNQDTTLVFVITASDWILRAFDIQGNELWHSSTPVFNPAYSSIPNAKAIGFADFNNDGWAEVYVGNQIFDAATGLELCNGGDTNTKGLVLYSNNAHGLFSIAADVVGNWKLELCAGSMVYDVDIKSRNVPSENTMSVVGQVQPEYPAGTLLHRDGATVVADFDADGQLEILVQTQANETTTGTVGYLYIWNPRTQQIVAIHQLSGARNRNVPFVGDINGDGKPEIVVLTADASGNLMRAFKVNGSLLSELWQITHTDDSGSTGLTLFDFNQDSIAEIVYRDETDLRIINGSLKSHITGADTIVYDLYSTPAFCGTVYEYPTVADIDNDGHAEILTTNAYDPGNRANDTRGELLIFKGINPWAPARPVWNQYMYNAVNVNNDLTIPRMQFNPASFMAGNDRMTGTSDDIQPFNNFLQQQTLLNAYGEPLWTIADAVIAGTELTYFEATDSATIRVEITNTGDAAFGSPIYVSVYKDKIPSYILTDSLIGHINPGETGDVIVRIPNISTYQPFTNFVVRINDRNGVYPWQTECDYSDSTAIVLNPLLSALLNIDATVNPHLDGAAIDNGRYANPVAILYDDKILYELEAVNANPFYGDMIVSDTLPAYLDYSPNTDFFQGLAHSSITPFFDVDTAATFPPRQVLRWTFYGLAPYDTVIIRFQSTAQSGACASQPLFVNRAFSTVPSPFDSNDSIHIQSANTTYHQGAGVALVTFSTSSGGDIYNAQPQALDFNTTPHSGILIVPHDGYVFTGWKHDEYISLRGETVPAQSGIMYYDSLKVKGNVELTAEFAPEIYSINYYLNGGINPECNPASFTILSDEIVLEAPHKEGDIFIGWTGSNGSMPEVEIIIPKGSVGERIYYANYLRSGLEDTTLDVYQRDNIWTSGQSLFVRTSTVGSIVRIYDMRGQLYKHHTILSYGTTSIPLSSGIYIVTVNNGVGRKVTIN